MPSVSYSSMLIMCYVIYSNTIIDQRKELNIYSKCSHLETELCVIL